MRLWQNISVVYLYYEVILSLRIRIRLITIITLLGLLSFVYFTTGAMLRNVFYEWKQRDNQQHLKHITSTIIGIRNQLSAHSYDWAIWDEMYDFSVNHNSLFIDRNFKDSNIFNNKLNMMAVVDIKGNIVYSKLYDLEKKIVLKMPADLKKEIDGKSSLVLKAKNKQFMGFLPLKSGCMLIAITPIRTSVSTGKLNAYYIVGKYINTKAIEKIAGLPSNSIMISTPALSQNNAKPYDYIKVRKSFKDIKGNPSIHLVYSSHDDIKDYGKMSLFYLMISLVITGIVFWVVIALLLDKSIVRRISRLSNEVEVIGHKDSLRELVTIDGNDEISTLANAFNNTYGKLHETKAELESAQSELELRVIERTEELASANKYLSQEIEDRKKAEQKIKIQASAIDSAGDMIVITTPTGVVEFVNSAFEKETGYKKSEIIGKHIRIVNSGELSTQFYKQLWDTILKGETWRGEIINRRKDGSLIHEEETITPIFNDELKIEHYLAIKRDITEKKAYEERLNIMAHQDALTALPNRLQFSDILTRRLNASSITGESLAVMFIDLDHFKDVNDTYGHNVGDQLLKEVAFRLMKTMRKGDVIARMGGDEFTVITNGGCTHEDVSEIAQRILDTFDEPVMIMGREHFISASVGISVYPEDADDVEVLVKNADTAMYQAKESGRNAYKFYENDMNQFAQERFLLEASLRRAMSNNEFIVYYQAQVDAGSGCVNGAEALVRWQNPELGLVCPDRFIPVAEQSGLIVEIGEWVLRTACEQNKKWQDLGYPPISMAINISARQFKERGDLLEKIKRTLDETKMDPSFLDLELTESTLMYDPERSAITLKELRQLGVKISIDDFGTGYSSLNYLKRFDVSSVKIDKSFVKDITTNLDDAAISKAVIAMAHGLGLNVLAEGVETIEQLEMLNELDCDNIQGYFINKPMPAEEFTRILLDSSVNLNNGIAIQPKKAA